MLLLSMFSVAAQDCNLTLRGRVIDFHNNEPLVGAVLRIQGAQQYTSTNLDGYYTLSGLCPGKVTLEISHISCEDLVRTLSLTDDRVMDFQLEHHLDELDEVVVTEHLHSRSSSAPEEVLTDEHLQGYLGAPMGDALDDLAGVDALRTGAAVVKPIIHGVYGSRIAIVKNGTRIESQQWGVEHAPVTDLNSSSTIRVVKGGAALRYGGDAVGGTIIMEPARPLSKDTITARAFFQGQTNGRGGATGARVTVNRESGWFGQASASFTRLGDYEAPDYILSNTANAAASANLSGGFRTFEWGAELNYNFYAADIGVLRSSHLGNVSDLVRGINSQEPFFIRDFTYDINPPRQEVEHHILKFSAFKRIRNFGKLSADYAYQYNQRLEFDVRRGGRTDQAALDLDLNTHDLNLHLEVDRFDTFELNAGIDLFYQNNFPDPATGVRRLIPDYDRYMAGAYVGAVHSLSRKLELDAGIRYDYDHMDALKFYRDSRWEGQGYDQEFPGFEVRDEGNQILTNPEYTFHNLAATAGLTYLMEENDEFAWDLNANLSHAVRSPNPSELFSDGVHQALASIELGDLRLEQERATKLALGTHYAKQKTDVSLTAYANAIDNFILLVPDGVETTIRGPFPVYSYTSADVVIAGADFDFTQVIADREKWTASSTIKASYIYGQNLDRDEALINMPAPRASLSLGIAEKSQNEFYLKLRGDFVARQDRFPDYDYTVSVLADDGTRTTEVVRISEPPAGYAIFGASVGGKFRFRESELNVRLNTTNIFDTAYRDYLNRQRFFAEELGRNFSISLTLNFL